MHRSRWAIAGLSLCLCACATSGPQHVAPASEDKLNGDYDQVKVATVNRWALDHGATVIWNHYPQKRKGTDGG
ncbi:MAG TPA: hypothetical protein VFI49_05325 [Rudaea sp.]|nr:hypothetical protein [Rudaea sp.]